jgi:nicotinamide mononucleotide transporter
LVATLAAWPLLGLLLARATDSDVPYFDALPTVASVTGPAAAGPQVGRELGGVAGRQLVSVLLFAYKGLWLTVVLYALFAVLSVVGWRAWRRLRSKPMAEPRALIIAIVGAESTGKTTLARRWRHA